MSRRFDRVFATTSPFARRIAGVFATRVAQFAIGFAVSFGLARLLGPQGRGAYYLVTLTPAMLFALGQFGLPSAISFFAGRGTSGPALLRIALVFAGVLSFALLALTLLALPWLEATVLRAAPPDLLRIALLSLPFQFVASFAGSLIIGRQSMRNYNVLLIVQSVATLILVILLVGVAGLGVTGAVVTNLAVAAGAALFITLEARRVSRGDVGRQAIRPTELMGYGFRVYPASVTSFFSYRVDVFLLGWLLADTRAIGLYSLAVSFAELTFFVPDAVTTVFFPRVAASQRSSADQMTPQVSRFTLLITGLAMLGLIPTAIIAVFVLLPAYTGSIPAFLVILPGVLSLSLAKVLSSYVSGLGLPLPVALASIVALSVNLVANLFLIPRWGIVGASASSLISYSVHAVVLLGISTRLAHVSPITLVIPGRAEVQRLTDGIRALTGRTRTPATMTGEADR